MDIKTILTFFVWTISNMENYKENYIVLFIKTRHVILTTLHPFFHIIS